MFAHFDQTKRALLSSGMEEDFVFSSSSLYLNSPRECEDSSSSCLRGCGVWQLKGRLPWALWVRPRKAAKGRGYVPSFTAGSTWGREQAAQSCFTAAFRAGPDFSAHTQSGKVIDNSMNFWGEFVLFYSVVH